MDIAIDFRTGDLKLSAHRDFAGISGPDEVVQRIHVRLMIERGGWLYDPTDGQLGSRLQGTTNMLPGRALGEVDLLIREALQPMNDIAIVDIETLIDPDNERQIVAHITYRQVSDPNETEVDTTQTISMPLLRT